MIVAGGGATLDPTSRIPLHEQLGGLLARQIAQGQFGPGDAIPPERRLCELYGVSITTVRRALLSLTSRGLVERALGERPRHSLTPPAARP